MLVNCKIWISKVTEVFKCYVNRSYLLIRILTHRTLTTRELAWLNPFSNFLLFSGLEFSISFLFRNERVMEVEPCMTIQYFLNRVFFFLFFPSKGPTIFCRNCLYVQHARSKTLDGIVHRLFRNWYAYWLLKIRFLII